MNSKMYETLATDLSIKPEAGKILFHTQGETPLCKERFFKIHGLNELINFESIAPQLICFIDGGNAPILETPSQSCHLCRTCAVTFSQGARTKTTQETFCVLSQLTKDHITLKGYGKELFIAALSIQDPHLCQGKKPASAQTAIELCRIICELDLAACEAKKIGPGGIIIIEGDLSFFHPFAREAFERLKTAISASSSSLVAISKTTTSRTETGTSAPQALQALGPPGIWGYLLESTDGMHRIFSKLHPSSRHIFMLSSPHPFSDILLSRITQASTDLAFPGYPYGLIVADQLARVSASEQEAASLILTTKARKQDPSLSQALAGSDAHAILDSMQY